jgi:hypothetical protein
VSDTAYHSFIGEVEALNTTTIRRLTPSRRHQLLAIALLPLGRVLVRDRIRTSGMWICSVMSSVGDSALTEPMGCAPES